MADDDFPWKEGPNGELPIVVAGGGISGLYCAYRLARQGHRVVVLERSRDCWGGRIETRDMDGFLAEYGPMRFELHLQPCLRKLLAELEIETIPFPGPEPDPAEYPQYGLTPVEKSLNSLQLLRRGLLLIMGRELDDLNDPDGKKRHQEWIDSLTEDDYDRIRRHGELHGQPLWKMGFWNALSAEGVLSHQALMKVRDTGTFYHMIPENLNAVEWIIWWLRALTTHGSTMERLKGGSGVLTDRILERLAGFYPRVQLFDGYELIKFRTAPERADAVRLTVRVNECEEVCLASRLILALPQWPLKQLADSLPPDISRRLDSVDGFPMTKVFFVTQRPWWKHDERPQTRASQMPTREVHYFRRAEEGEKDDGHGMVLIYTDRPATEYWNVYVDDKEGHDRAEIEGNPELKAQFARWLVEDAIRAAASRLRENFDQIDADLKQKLGEEMCRLDPGLPSPTEGFDRLADLTGEAVGLELAEGVLTYGIRDWSLPPYGAANHSWKPGVKSWEVIDVLKQFRLDPGCPGNVHICGEAYSDYSGFIEGALRSAELALATIPAPEPSGVTAAV